MNAIVCSAMPTEPATWFVCALGVSVVFSGLLFLIGIIYLMNLLTEKLGKKETPAPLPQARVFGEAPIENRQEILAAVCAAVAEENGTDISAIKVISFKKI